MSESTPYLGAARLAANLPSRWKWWSGWRRPRDHAPEASSTHRALPRITDNGPCFKAARFAAFIEKRPELIHIRTRRKSPQQNGVRERAFGSLKYEHLYRHEIDDGFDLGIEVEVYRQLFNTVRPHEALDWQRPLDLHLEACTTRESIKSTRARNPANFVTRDRRR